MNPEKEWDEVEEKTRPEEYEPTVYELAEEALRQEERIHKYLWDSRHAI